MSQVNQVAHKKHDGEKPAVSLKVMKERGMPGVSTVKSWGVDPRLVQFEPGFNRPINREHVESIKASLRAGQELDDIKVRIEDGNIIAVDGHHRVAAAVEWLAEPGVREPEGGFQLGAKQFRGGDAERVIHLITSSQGLGLTPLERSAQYRKLVGWGWTSSAIADAVGRSVQNVSDALVLADANSDVKLAVTEKQISASNAAKIVRQSGGRAGAVIAEHVEAARLQGKAKATAKQIAGNTPKDLVAAIRREIESGGTFRAEEVCPTFADLITYLRGTAAGRPHAEQGTE
ncbi:MULTISPECIES: hypothetical protein [Massilia]|uniref:ParB/Spo0J HTH domain-containing protein n=1 Tax=Massilia genomosp. 1 TaxID=2609280 RepID=A0ABX0MRQ6_9BURK|nr:MULTISPECIES: hypothetical protein [Massilia]NHZ62630.1 hypothetical protein [Massilia genomosp. 1]NIA00094.1 hypothetical protein [Massilia sp. CCM 8734]